MPYTVTIKRQAQKKLQSLPAMSGSDWPKRLTSSAKTRTTRGWIPSGCQGRRSIVCVWAIGGSFMTGRMQSKLSR
jgi:hypothetical protein